MEPELDGLISDIREQVLYLHELGVEACDIEMSATQVVLSAVAERAVERVPIMQEGPVKRIDQPPPPLPPAYAGGSDKVADRKPGSRLASLPSLSSRKTMPFFDKYNPGDEGRVTSDEGRGKDAVLFNASPVLTEPTETIEQIRAEIGPDCTRCKLSQLGRRQVVNSVGNFNADLMFVGEAPGADEDIQGEPFVGKAGQLLTDIIEKGLQMPRSSVFIGNINRCRPPGNRAPEPDESVVCKPFLQREIAVVRPRVIVVLGATAAQNLLETKVPISKLRGHFHDYMGVKVMPTFHPAYLLRDPHKKREVWEDMKMVRDLLSEPPT
jgi:uracil-DNA glycosylase family 4